MLSTMNSWNEYFGLKYLLIVSADLNPKHVSIYFTDLLLTDVGAGKYVSKYFCLLLIACFLASLLPPVSV